MKIIVRGIPWKDGFRRAEVRGYESSSDRARAITMLKKQGYDHFTKFVDVQSNHALMFGRSAR